MAYDPGAGLLFDLEIKSSGGWAIIIWINPENGHQLSYPRHGDKVEKLRQALYAPVGQLILSLLLTR